MTTTMTTYFVKKESSIELGTPGKKGVIKVYVDPDNLLLSKARIDAMVELQQYLHLKVDV